MYFRLSHSTLQPSKHEKELWKVEGGTRNKQVWKRNRQEGQGMEKEKREREGRFGGDGEGNAEEDREGVQDLVGSWASDYPLLLFKQAEQPYISESGPFLNCPPRCELASKTFVHNLSFFLTLTLKASRLFIHLSYSPGSEFHVSSPLPLVYYQINISRVQDHFRHQNISDGVRGRSC